MKEGQCRASVIRVMMAGLLLILLVGYGFGLDREKPIQLYNHEIWRIKQGLTSDTVRTIIQTRDGYIWIATQAGLARFDGLQFTVFDKTNVPEFASNVIYHLWEDRRGTLWIASRGALIAYKDGKFHAYTTRDGLSSS